MAATKAWVELNPRGRGGGGFGVPGRKAPAEIRDPDVTPRSTEARGEREECRTAAEQRDVVGRIFFEEVIRENLDIGRPRADVKQRSSTRPSTPSPVLARELQDYVRAADSGEVDATNRRSVGRKGRWG